MTEIFALTPAPLAMLWSYIHWDVDPIIGTLGPLTFRYYGILFAAGLLWAHAIFVKLFEREGDDPEQAIILTYWLVAAIILGARFGHVFFYDPEHYLKQPIEMFKFWKGGLASHGAVIGIIIVMWVYAVMVRSMPFRVISDRLAIAVPPTMITVRLGNLFNSEVYGRQTDVPWAFVFERIDQIPRHPSQLYETFTGILLLFMMFGIERYYHKRGEEKPLGITTSVLVVVYFGMRFTVEFFKEYQTLKSGLTMGQYLSIPFIIAGVFGIWMCMMGPWKKQRVSHFIKKTPAAEPSSEP